MATYVRDIEDNHGDLVDMHYFCSRGCWSDSFAPSRIGPAASDRSRDSSPRGGAMIGGEYPCAASDVDYDVHCAECGVLMNGPDAPVVVNLIERPPVFAR